MDILLHKYFDNDLWSLTSILLQAVWGRASHTESYQFWMPLKNIFLVFWYTCKSIRNVLPICSFYHIEFGPPEVDWAGLALLVNWVTQKDTCMNYVKIGSALRQLTFKPSEFRAVLAVGRQICRKEEKQTAFTEIQTSKV